MPLKNLSIAPFLVFADPTNNFKTHNVFQADGPDSITQGYAIVKNRGDDLPFQILEGKALDEVLTAAQAMADSLGVPLFRPAWLNKLRPQIASVQVVPCIEIADGISDHTMVTTIQPDGPTTETTGWSVYLRMSDGSVTWVADSTRTEAGFIGEMYAKHHGVELEAQLWMKDPA